MLNLLFTVAVLLVVLGVLVFVHELGHFLAAKAFGIYVLRFSLGLGSPVRRLTWHRGETEYSISWLPLGGYVKMATAEEDATSTALEGGKAGATSTERPAVVVPPDRMFEAKPVWVRMIVILAGVTMNTIFAWLTYSWLAATNGEQIDPETRVGGVEVDSLPPGAEALAYIRPGDRIVAINGDSVASWNEVQQGILTASGDSVPVRLADGRVLTLGIHHTASTDRLRAVTALAPFHVTLIQSVEAGRPGARAGFAPGDTILAVDDRPVTQWDQVFGSIRASPGIPIRLLVGRPQGRREISVTPDSVVESGRTIGKVGLGLTPAASFVNVPYSTMEALGAGARETLARTTQIVRTVQGLLSGRVSRRDLGGPILIAQVAAESAKLGLDTFLGVLAFVSINLAVLNLLPIPVLDGGQFVFLLAEAVLRRPLPLRLREQLTLAGLVVIVLLMVLAFSNDFRRVLGL
jgi:regulator of sigma E protease